MENPWTAQSHHETTCRSNRAAQTLSSMRQTSCRVPCCPVALRSVTPGIPRWLQPAECRAASCTTYGTPSGSLSTRSSFPGAGRVPVHLSEATLSKLVKLGCGKNGPQHYLVWFAATCSLHTRRQTSRMRCSIWALLCFSTCCTRLRQP